MMKDIFPENMKKISFSSRVDGYSATQFDVDEETKNALLEIGRKQDDDNFLRHGKAVRIESGLFVH